MDPPPPTAPPITTTTPPPTSTTTTTYPDSLDSSPRSRATDFDDTTTTTTTFLPSTTTKLRLMCSYGGHIVPRPHDKSLCYVGGDTRIVVVDRSSTLPDLLSRLSKTLLNNKPFTLKYQLPNEDLDSLITVSTDEDFDNMVDEYDRLSSSSSSKPSRIRLFLFPNKPGFEPGISSASIGSVLDGSNRSEDWFLNALNGANELQRGFSDPASVNCLLGLDVDGGGTGAGTAPAAKKSGNNNQDVHSVPDSPIIETTSSFGSTSSSPSLANLPPIRVHVEEPHKIGIEEQFAQMGIGVAGGGGVQKQQQQVDEGFVVLSTPPNAIPVMMTTAGGVAAVGGEFGGRVFSDDERSDQGVPVGYRKQQQQQLVQQQQQGGMVAQGQQQQKQMSGGGGGVELPSPDSVSSDSSLSNAISRQKPAMYQDPVGHLSSGSNRLPQNLMDPNARIQMQQVSETGYALPPQYDQFQQQLLQQHQQHQHQQLQQQQQQQQQQTQPQPQTQQPQYIPAGAHFVHHPGGAVPLSTYYQMYPPQQPQHHHPHQYPVYYVPAGQPQPYTMPLQHQPQQQQNLGEAANAIPQNRPQTPPNPTIITTSSGYNQTRNVGNVAPQKPEMGGVYRTAAGPQLVQVPSGQQQHQPPQSQPQPQPQPQQQQQFVGYSQIHHPSQSVAQNSAAGYGYEFSDPAHAQIYYTQPLGPTLAAQYQAGATMLDSQLPNDNLKQQQVRSSQPL